MKNSKNKFLVAALYKFKKIKNTNQYKNIILNTCKKKKIKGTILIAHEGINGTIAGKEKNIKDLIKILENDGLKPLNVKYSYCEDEPFLRLKVKVKKEIVTLGIEKLDARKSGTRVKPKDWNKLINNKNIMLIDTRNTYEIAIGSFENAVNPKTTNFREFPKWVEEKLKVNKKTPIAMFCTGGIRCEKSTALLKEKGYENVFHLDGGILQYLKDVPENESKWKGTCFVFDERVSLTHDLTPSEHVLCHACRMPLNEKEQKSTQYKEGIACPHCFNKQNEKQKNRFKERQKQITLAKKRNVPHLAANIKELKKKKTNDQNRANED